MKDEDCKKLLELMENKKLNLKKYQEAKEELNKIEQDYIESVNQFENKISFLLKRG